ncbi:hypothetical protein K7X08_008504 [Anisodus acutangulus]|uniref:Uncharacterized protein n=1 Tax=Anisodus acutangulus TaxID=402998 RepID=A0A9Q1RQ21_9SOLA|nr:hypothetical protein K7X08_008504 [Anisodus acutangulus]
MRDGKIVQSGKYEELLELGTDFDDLVAAHENSMELVESSSDASGENLPQTPKSPQKSQEEANGESSSLDQQLKGSSKIIDDEERDSSWHGAHNMPECLANYLPHNPPSLA